MKHTIHNEALTHVVAGLGFALAPGIVAQPDLITKARLLSLPEPVQRYLNYAQVVGKDPIRTVRLKQQGSLLKNPKTQWNVIIAEEAVFVEEKEALPCWEPKCGVLLRRAPYRWSS